MILSTLSEYNVHAVKGTIGSFILGRFKSKPVLEKGLYTTNTREENEVLSTKDNERFGSFVHKTEGGQKCKGYFVV